MSWSFGSALAKEFQKIHEEDPEDLLAELNADSLCQSSRQEAETEELGKASALALVPMETRPSQRPASAPT